MSNIRPKFVEKDFNTVLRELCSEARQRIWKKSPNTQFLINGKTYKKQEEFNKAIFKNSESVTVDGSSNSSQSLNQFEKYDNRTLVNFEASENIENEPPASFIDSPIRSNSSILIIKNQPIISLPALNGSLNISAFDYLIKSNDVINGEFEDDDDLTREAPFF